MHQVRTYRSHFSGTTPLDDGQSLSVSAPTDCDNDNSDRNKGDMRNRRGIDPDRISPSLFGVKSISESGRSQTPTAVRRPIVEPGISARNPTHMLTSNEELRQYQLPITAATTPFITLGTAVNYRKQQSLEASSDEYPSLLSATSRLGVRGVTPVLGSVGHRDKPHAGITLEDVNHAVELRRRQCRSALSTLHNSLAEYQSPHPRTAGEQITDRKPDIHDLVRGLEAGRSVNEFVASFLSTNGYNMALALFEKRLPLAEQQLQGCLHYHNQRQQQQREQDKRQQTSCRSKNNTFVTTEEKMDTVTPSPTYAFTNDDLLLFMMERVRREKMLNDTLPWRDVNCRSKDYCLELLEHHHEYQNGTTGTGSNPGDNQLIASKPVGGSLDLLIEVLILVETDTPFTRGMPIFNYTNIFILLSSLFVIPEVLIVRLIRLFRHIQQQLPVDDGRCVFLQCRILQFIMAYCKFNEADITYELLERLEGFLQSCNIPHPPSRFTFESFETNRNCAPVPSPTGKLQSVHSTIAVEVANNLNKLSLFIGDTLRKNYILVRNNSVTHDTTISWQSKLATPVKPLGTLLSEKDGSDEAQTEEKATFLRDTIPLTVESYREIVFTEVDVETLANQMCLLTFRLFANIHLRELMDNAWCDEIMRLSVPHHLTRLIDYLSHLQRWITILVVRPKRWSECESAMQQGVHFLRLLYKKQNYEAAAAVLAGLQDPAVCTLEKLYRQCFKRSILDTQTQEIYSTLQASMDPFASSESPSSLQSIGSRMSTGTMEGATIPLLSPVLGVLFRTAEVKGKTVEVSLRDGIPIINWSKMLALAKTVFIWLRCQNTPYQYTVDHKLQFYLWQMPGHHCFDRTIANLAKQERVK